MLDLARQHPTFSIHGFDITSTSFPAKEYRPQKIAYHVWNAFHDVPMPFVGTFDVVHVRTLFSAVKNNKVKPLLSNLLRMLKPGG
jgi:hypothetical protein